MNSGPTSERVYDAIKRRLLDGGFRPGERLDPALLAPEVASSITPVRDALNRLTGEGLVETATSDGFRTPHIDEPSLKDLYAWTLETLLLAIKSWDARKAVPPPDTSDPDGAGSHRMAALFLAIAARSANAEHLRAVQAINDRLSHARIMEAAIVPVAADEAQSMAETLMRQDRPALTRLLKAYYRLRIRHAASLVRALYRA